MSDLQVVRQTSIGYSNHGDSVYSTDSFVKVEVSFNKSGSLRLLKGAPLSVFMCVALHEADAKPGASLSTMEHDTGYTSPTIIAAIRFLQDADHRFVDEIGVEEDGTKRYRVSAYAWFGNGRPKSGGGKISLPPASSGKTFPPVVVVDDCIQSLSYEKGQQQHLFCAESKKILHAAGIGDPALTKLSSTVSPERAEMWRDWLSDPPVSFKRPSAYAVKRLSEDPTTDPPGWTLALWQKWREEDAAEQSAHDAEVAAEEQSPHGDAPSESRYRQDGTADLWHATLGELQLQMTKSTFDTWVRPTHPLGWNDDTDDQLVVGVHSPYAKEWLEHRLATTVQRTVTGIAGHTVTIRYEVKDR